MAKSGFWGMVRPFEKQFFFFWRDKEDSIDNCSPKQGTDGKWESSYRGRAGGRGHQLKFSRKNWGLLLSKVPTYKFTVKIISCYGRKNFYRAIAKHFPKAIYYFMRYIPFPFASLNKITNGKLSHLFSKIFSFNSECVSLCNEEGREVSKV